MDLINVDGDNCDFLNCRIWYKYHYC